MNTRSAPAKRAKGPKTEKVRKRSPENNLPHTWRHFFFRWQFAILLAVIIFFGAIRWRLADTPLERDEGEYAYSGQLMLQGIPPYQLAYNMKLPGTYAFYAATLAVFGQTGRGIHLGFLLVNAVCIILLYLIASRLFGALAGVIAGASYAFFSTHQSCLGFAAHATHLVTLAALFGLILALRAEETRRWIFFCGSGLAFGIAFLMKQPGILLGAFAFLYLAVRCWPKDPGGRGQWAKNLGVFLLAAALPFVLTCALLYRAGVFGNFWFWTFSYASRYATTTPMRVGLMELQRTALGFFRAAPWLWILALVGVSTPFWNAPSRRHAFFVFGLLFSSFAAASPGLYFRQHYFIPMLPAIALLIAVAISSFVDLVAAKSTSRWFAALPVLAFVAAWGLAIIHNSDVYFELTPLQACHRFYGGNPFPEAAKVADLLRRLSAPSDTVMVFGSEPEIYFDAQRHSASGYIYMYSLTEDQSYRPVMQQQMMHEVEASRPAYVVMVDFPFSWLIRVDPSQVLAMKNWMARYIADNYEEAGVIGSAPPGSHNPDSNESDQHARPKVKIAIYKRKG